MCVLGRRDSERNCADGDRGPTAWHSFELSAVPPSFRWLATFPPWRHKGSQCNRLIGPTLHCDHFCPCITGTGDRYHRNDCQRPLETWAAFSRPYPGNSSDSDCGVWRVLGSQQLRVLPSAATRLLRGSHLRHSTVPRQLSVPILRPTHPKQAKFWRRYEIHSYFISVNFSQTALPPPSIPQGLYPPSCFHKPKPGGTDCFSTSDYPIDPDNDANETD